MKIADFAYLQSPFFSFSASFFSKASFCSCFNFIIYYSALLLLQDLYVWLALGPLLQYETAIILLVVLHFYFSMHGCLAARFYALRCWKSKGNDGYLVEDGSLKGMGAFWQKQSWEGNK